MTPAPATEYNKAQNPLSVFISYAHSDNDADLADARWLDRLIQHLGPVVADGFTAVWADKDIGLGERWHTTIQAQINSARVAVLLVSPAFLASEYIRNHELPVFLDRAERGAVSVIPVILRPCLFSSTVFHWPDPVAGPNGLALSEFQASNPISRPLNSMTQAEQDEVFVDVAKRVQQILIGGAASANRSTGLRKQATAVADDNRNRLCKRVKTDWIEGVLDRTLYSVAPLKLDLSDQSQSVEKAWDLVINQPGSAPLIQTTGRIEAIFDDFNRQLLILGEPGAGKTILLLTLASKLLGRASADNGFPIPVVLNLSTWGERRLPLDRWLVEELNKRYDVHQKLAKEWVLNDGVVFLLDGLDEVTESCRDHCISAINRFRVDHQWLAVCCRTRDYEQLSERLRLSGAVTLVPLSRGRVDQYLVESGDSLVRVKLALEEDKSLYELFDTPLMLSVAAVGFQGGSAGELSGIEGLEARRSILFGRYVENAFTRPGRTKYQLWGPYRREQTEAWLTWLSSAMKHTEQSSLHLGWMQPSWLSSRSERAEFRMLRALFLALVVSMTFFFPACLMTLAMDVTLVYKHPDSISSGWILILEALFIALIHGVGIGAASLMPNPALGAVCGAFVAIITRLIFHVSTEQRWQFALLVTLFAILGWIFASVFGGRKAIVPRQRLSWSWRAIGEVFWRRVLEGGASFLLIGSLAVWAEIVPRSATATQITPLIGAALVIFISILGMIAGAMVAVIFGGLKDPRVVVHSRPNSETVNSGRIAGIFLLLSELPSLLGTFEYKSGMAFVSRFWMVHGPDFSILAYFWAFAGIMVASHFGGYSFLQHYTMRGVLWRRNYAPANYVRFLNYVVGLGLMRRVGSSYVFFHGMLVDYLASRGATTNQP